MSKVIYFAVVSALTPAGQFTDDTGVIVRDTLDDCTAAVTLFLNKHSIPEREECLPIPIKKYQDHIQGVFVQLGIDANPLRPPVAGYVCKKNKRGKLYKCNTYRERP